MLTHFLNLYYSPWINLMVTPKLKASAKYLITEQRKSYLMKTEVHKINNKVMFVDFFLAWTFLYFVYKKCLNEYFRNAGIAFVRRNRIINVLWSLVINNICIFYLIFLRHLHTEQNFGDIILKSYYIHYSILMILVNKNRLQGFFTLVLTLSVFGTSDESLRQHTIRIFLINIILILIWDISKILYLVYYKKLKKFSKNYPRCPYVIYFLTCLFLCEYMSVHLILFPNLDILLYQKIYFQVWLTNIHLLYILLVFIKNVVIPQSFESWLFPRLSAESVYLSKFLTSSKELGKSKFTDPMLARKELWQTLFCAMAMKKKINKLKKLKQAKLQN